MSAPLISFVTHGRNDGFMGDFLWRISTCINQIARNYHALGRLDDIEILVGDWGSEQKTLREAMTLEPAARRVTRFCTVPPAVAARLNRDGDYGYSPAANIPIRRATGRFVFSMDSDAWMPFKTAEYLLQLAEGKGPAGLDLDRAFFWASRQHLPYAFIATSPTIGELERFLVDHRDQAFWTGKCNLKEFRGGAVAIFGKREVFHAIRGYNEALVHWGWHDVDIHYRLAMTFTPHDLWNLGAEMFHMEHYPKRGGAVAGGRKMTPQILPSRQVVNGADWGASNDAVDVSPAPEQHRAGTRNIVISGTNFWNPGDDFVRDGVIRVLHEVFPGDVLNFLFYNFNADFFPQSKFAGIGNFVSRGDLEKYRDHIDVVAIAGLSAGEEIKDLYRWVVANGLASKVWLIGAGYENGYVEQHISREPEATIFRQARIVTGRTAKTPGFIRVAGVPYHHINCPAILSVPAVKAVPAGKKIERIGFSIQLSHGEGLANQSCDRRQYELAVTLLRELARQYAVEVVAHHKSEYFHFLKLLQGENIPVIFSSFYQDLHGIYPRYDLMVTTRLHASLFANGHGIPGIIINDTDRHTHTLDGFLHSTWVHSREGFDQAFARWSKADLSAVAGELEKFKADLLASYLTVLRPMVTGGAAAVTVGETKAAARPQPIGVKPAHDRLNVGSGWDYLEGFVNVDGNAKLPKVDVVLEIAPGVLAKYFAPGSFRYVLAKDFIEHHFHWEARRLLEDFYAILAENGELELVLPDLEVIVNDKTTSIHEKRTWLYGGQDITQAWETESPELSRKTYPQFFCHKFGWTKDFMRQELKAVGFDRVVIGPDGKGWNMRVRAIKPVASPAQKPVNRSPAAGLGDTNLPVHFFTIVLNGQPFIRHHIEQLRQLPFAWHWHLVEGVAELNHDTGWSKAAGGRIPAGLHRAGLSTDGTTEYLDALKKEFPGNITIYRPPAGKFWDGKREMVNAPLANLAKECLLWQVDADELWTPAQIIRMREMFLAHPEKSAAYCFCHYFVGRDLVITSRNTYGNNTSYEWLRVWRYQPGDRWAAHEPPQLRRQGREVASLGAFRHAETEAAGLVFHHYAYVLESQLQFKESYYGYAGAVNQWRRLQAVRQFPARLADYFPWVKDGALVNTTAAAGIQHLAPAEYFGPAADGQPGPLAGAQRVLFVRTDSIGDAVLASAMLEPIKKKYPQAKLAVVCQRHIAELLVACPFVDTIICYERLKMNDAAARAQILAEIAAFRPDVILNSMRSRNRLSDLFALEGKEARHLAIEADTNNISEPNRAWTNAQYELIASPGAYKPELERHADFLRGLGIAAGHLQPVVWTAPADEALADSFFQEQKLDPARTIAIWPGAQADARIYHHYAEALKGLEGFRHLIFGDASQVDLARKLQAQLGASTYNLCGRTSLPEAAALMRRCRLYVGAESAGAHLACAVGIPNVVLVGGGHFGRFMPYSALTSVAALPLACFKCNWTCPHPRAHCVQDIAPAVVAEAIRQTLEKNSPRPRIFLQSPKIWPPGMNLPAWQKPEALLGGLDVEYIEVAGAVAPESLNGSHALPGVNNTRSETASVETIPDQHPGRLAPAPGLTPPGRAKIVGMVPGRNEAHRIEFCLRALARYTDAIVYLDDCSTDDSVAVVESLARECKVERIIRKQKWHLDEPADRNAMLQAGREIGGTHFIALDADEAFTANCAQEDSLRRLLLSLRPGDRLHLTWIQLWRSVQQYRFDGSVWTNNVKPFAFCDDGRCYYNHAFFTHTPRVPNNLQGRIVTVGGYVHGVLHFQFVNWRNLQIKQAWYRCLEHIRDSQRTVAQINARYAATEDETGLATRPSPANWFSGYDFFDPQTQNTPDERRLAEVRQWFQEYGRDFFAELDIWRVDWGLGGQPADAGRQPSPASEAPLAGPGTDASTPLVTAVVSAYASERFMEGCLRDLVAQTLGERLEIIVVDTGSPEKEGEIVRRFMERHANIRYLRVEQRETVTQAYNRGARAARGKYVITTNTDDRLRPDALARLAQELDAHPEVGLVYADYFITNTENDEFYRHVRTGYSRKPDYHPNIMLDGCHMGPQPMWRRSLHEELGWFDEQMIAAGDYELWCRFAAKHPFRHVPEFLGLYLHNPAGVSNSNAARSASETARIWATYAGQFPPPPPGLPRGFFYREAVRPHRYVNIGMVTFNRLEFTRQVIETLVRHTNFPYVLTVVDNGSQDGTREYLMELRRQGIIRNLLLLEGNVGVTKAANLAWRQEPEAGYYLKLDNDILLQKAGWLKSMVEALEGVPQLGAVAYNFEPVSYSVVPMNNHRLRPKPEGYLGGACILIPKRTEQALGYWREECGLDGEADHDYCLRIRRQGGLIAYMEDEATGFHLPSGRAALIHPRTFEARDGQEETIHGEARRFKEDQQRQQVSSGKRDHFEADDLGGPRPLFQASASFWPGGTNLPAGNAPDALLPGPKVEGIALPCASVPGSMDGSRPVPPSPPPETAAVPAGKPAEKIPLFIITCNRLQCLQASIESYKQHIATPYEIVIHDNNSTYEPLLEYLRQLERDGVAVYRSATNVAAEEQLNLVANTVEHWFTTHAPSHYVVTDPDVALEGSCEDILQLYAYLLEGNPDIKVVGPMLRIDDIPDYYPLKQKVIASHTRQFWHKTPLNLCWKNKNVQYQLAPIDTTFGMYRRGFKFRRLCHGFRIYAPYWAKHLDWYINPATMSADQVYYLQHASGVSHWGGTWLRNSLSEQSSHGLPAQRQENGSSLKDDILPVCSNA